MGGTRRRVQNGRADRNDPEWSCDARVREYSAEYFEARGLSSQFMNARKLGCDVATAFVRGRISKPKKCRWRL